ncbi:GRAM domain containing protein [Metarhizium album ARSEF 1941]|uniref:GRAM domain containing protein n=1 Tax=Metarhizium album (strain ARSEF 1941) TaxID=1081103 RepID=A0A0B2WM32_METAS|nr:GRAM domain containing protein [Metarhizium album ARSEF 1941]KHN94075.1 GRAM domain containing protein [Metarhizium album ARSEF 1941]
MDGTAPGSSGGGLRVGKLLPKGLSTKRRRRKGKTGRDSEASGPDEDTRSTSPHSARRRFRRELTLESDDANSTNSTNMADDDDRSFGSFESGADAETADRARPASSSAPARPATISAHPSLIGYLTTSSPVVQTQHLDSQSHFLLSSPPDRGSSSGSSDKSLSPKQLPKAQGAPGVQNSIPEPPAPAKIVPAVRRGRAVAPKIETNPPRTPPRDDQPAPVIVNTPPTPIDRTDSSQLATSPDGKPTANGANPRRRAEGSAAASNMNIHTRSKSGSAAIGPSKLSHITAAPLTPTDDTGGESTANATSGFFSSVISAAQSAATSISNTIPSGGLGIGGNKSRVSTPKSLHSPNASQTTVNSQPAPEPEPRIEDTMDRRESAVRTLGSGDLSLSHLGLPDSSVASPASARFADTSDNRLRSESAPTEPQTSATDAGPAEPSSRPRSLAEPTTGERTPSQEDLTDLKGSIHRSSSLRSAVKPRRKRGSSVTTGGTIAAAVTSANNAALPPSGGLGAPKLTGFAIASKKRNRDFHNLFKSVPDDDYLIEDYSCALQREILAHGRLYVSEGHLCFSSNILGWTTTLVMSFDEIVSMEKRSTALVFKNGLMISTLHAKHIFASFTSRDATYDLIVNIWKLGHPTLRSTLNGVQLEGTGGDKTEKVQEQQEAVEAEPPKSGSEEETEDDEGDEDEFYDEEEHDEALETQSTDLTAAEPEPEKLVTRRVSGMTVVNGVSSEAPKGASPPPGSAVDFPGPSAHAPTDCGDSAAHYDKVLGDETIPAPLGKVYNLVFGPGSVTWMSRWLSTDQKCTEIQMEDKKGLTADNNSRTFTYIKPLNGSIGPKQTKCVVTENMDQMDLEKAINLSVSTQNPDVPYGNLFTVKTKYCLSWAENNATRIQVNCTVEWSGKCWLKGTIEKNVNDGQGQYCKELFASLKSAVSSRARSGTATNGLVKGKKKLKRSKALQAGAGLETIKGSKSEGRKQSWGALEPVRSIIEPCVDALQPVLTGNVMYGLLVGLLVAMWFGYGTPPKDKTSYGPEVGFYSHRRQAAYEEMWRRQDSELWEWLEERVGMERLSSDQASGRRRAMEHRTVEEKLREERMDEGEIQEAIRVTEEKLRVLREVVGKGHGSSK